MVKIDMCIICGRLLSIEEQEQCTIGQFKVCKEHYDFFKVLSSMIREGKI